MKNNNSKSFSSVVVNLLVLIFSLVGMTVIINWISKKVSNWIMNLISPEVKKKAATKAVAPLLKESIKNVKPLKFADLEKTKDRFEKTMRSIDKVINEVIDQSTTKEVIDEDQVPENIMDKVEKVTIKKMSEEELPEDIREAVNASKNKTFINGKIYDKVDQFINDCKALKRSKIGSHRVPNDDLNSHWDINYAKLVKKNLTQAEKDWAESFELDGFTRSRALEFCNKYFTEVNNYIRNLNVNVEQVSFEETDEIINKYFGEV